MAVSWHLNGNFQYDPDPAKASRVEVTFHAESPERTRVELVHSGLERHGEGWERVREIVSARDGWPLLLDRFSARAQAA